MSPTISFAGFTTAGTAGAAAATGSVAAGSAAIAGLASENWLHCSAVRPLFMLTLKNADPKSLFGYADSGTATAANATPPGCTKSIGTGSDETSLSAASPVFNEYFRGYSNETPEVLSA